MAEPPSSRLSSIEERLAGEGALRWLHEQRWFAAKSQSLQAIEVLEQARVEDRLTLALVQARFASGAHELYQLVLSGDERGHEHGFDTLSRPESALALLQAIERGAEVDGLHGRFCFCRVGPGLASSGAGDGDGSRVRPAGVEQSNSSVIYDERIVLKLFRKLEPGINPELEMLRFLTEHGYAHIAPLHGWYEYEGEALAATLAVAQGYVADAVDGWELALQQIPREPDAFLDRLAELGSVTAHLHTTLASGTADPAFSPQDPSSESLNILRATLDDQLERLFLHLPDDPALAPIAGLEQTLRDSISLPSQSQIGGKSIRIHGDYHLGQALHSPRGWTLLDFEGEPARPLSARRIKRSPLRDVAGMLRSLSYAVQTVALRGSPAPAGFEPRARAAFLDAYLDRVDPLLLPRGDAQVAALIAAFELEKALYELQYELDNRPDWTPVAVAGILSLLERA